MSTLTQQQNKELFHHLFDEVWNRGNYDGAYQIIDPGFTIHGTGGQPTKQGPEGLIELVSAWRSAFPGASMTIDDLFSEGEFITARLILKGTQRERFYSIPASGKQIEATFMFVTRINHGKIVAAWTEVDMLDVMRQLDVVSASVTTTPQRAIFLPPLRTATFHRPLETAPMDNKEVYLRFIQALNEWDLDEICELVDVDVYLEHTPDHRTIKLDESLRAHARLRQALPDLHLAPHPRILIGEENRVALRVLVSGTHTGSELFDIPTTEAHLDWTGIDIARIAHSKIVERWTCSDMWSVMRQLRPSNNGESYLEQSLATVTAMPGLPHAQQSNSNIHAARNSER